MAAISFSNPGFSIYRWFLEHLQKVPLVRRVLNKFIKNRDLWIVSGPGVGLRFNMAFSTPTYLLGTNELSVQQALSSTLQKGDVFLDIGANIGFFSVIAARLVGKEGHVYAFEPVPKNAACLRRNTALNLFQQVTVFETAVSDKTGEGELLLAEWTGGSALATASVPPDMIGKMIIPLVTVDDLVEQGRIVMPSMVKIDVEGAELNVLQGMEATIRTCQPAIIFEIDDSNQEAFMRKYNACEAFLQRHGYLLTRLDDSYSGASWLVGNFLATYKNP